MARFCGHPGGLIQLGTCDGGEWKAATILEHEFRQDDWCSDFGKFCPHLFCVYVHMYYACTLYFYMPHAHYMLSPNPSFSIRNRHHNTVYYTQYKMDFIHNNNNT